MTASSASSTAPSPRSNASRKFLQSLVNPPGDPPGLAARSTLVHTRTAMRLPAALLLLAALPAGADTVTLKHGAVFTGAVLEDTGEKLVLLSDGVTWRFRKANVAKIKLDKAERDAELKRSKLADAGKDEAREAGKARPWEKRRAIVVYGASWCGFCAKARAYFTQRGVAFDYRDVEKNPAAQLELQDKCARHGLDPDSIPVIDIDGELVQGFDRGRIDGLLARRWR